MISKRKIWIGLVAAFVLLVLFAAAGGGGLYLYLQHRNQQWRADAEAFFAEGNWREAKDYFALYLVQYPDDEAALTMYGEACLNILQLRRGSLQQAAIAYQQLLQYHPESEEIREKLFGLYEKTGSWTQVEYYVNDMLRSRPDDEGLLKRRAVALDRLGRRDEAIEAYRDLVERGSASAEIYGSLARLLKERGYEQQALDLLDEALNERPGDVAVRVERARYFGQSRQWDGLEAELAEAEKLDPDDPGVLTLQAQRAVTRRDWDRAVELSQRALEGAPERLDVYLMSAHALTRKGEPEKAAALLGRLDSVTLVDNPDLLVTLADLQLSLRAFEDADKSVALFEQAYPERRGMIDYLAARRLMAKGDYAAASETLASVAERLPSFAPAQYFLAVSYRESGKEELARTTLEAYLRKRPEDTRARALLAAQGSDLASASQYETAAIRMLTDSREDDAPADPEACVSTALALFEASSREGDATHRLDTIEELFEQAIRDEPVWPTTYRAYADVLVAVGNLTKAKEVLQRALDAGISPFAVAPAQADLAIAEGDKERAWALCEQSTANPEMTVADYVAWSSLFTRRGMAKEAGDVLSRGIDRAEQGLLPDEDGGPEATATALRVERLILAVYTGEAREPLDELTQLSRTESANQEVIRARLNAARLVIAERLLNDGSEAEQEQGLALLEQVRSEEPENSALLTMDAQLLLRSAEPDVEAAEALLRSATETDPDNAAAWMGLAHAARLKGDLREAVDDAERAASLARHSTPLQLQLAELQIRLGRYLAAEKALMAILDRAGDRLNQDEVTALELLTTSYIAGKRLTDAERAFGRLEASVGQEPEWARRLDALRSSLLLAEGITDPRAAEEAQQAVRSQYEADPDDFTLARKYAGALRQAGQEEQGARVLEDYATRHAENVEAWLALARFYLGSEGSPTASQLASASTALTQALVVRPNYLPALREMIEVQVRTGNLAQALALCDRYLEQKPDEAEILHRKASLMARLGAGDEVELRKAIDVVDGALLVEEKPEFLATKGAIYLSMKNYEEALKCLQPLASGYGQTTAELDAALAEAYAGTGDLELAREYVSSASRKAKEGQPLDERVLERVSSMLDELQAAIAKPE